MAVLKLKNTNLISPDDLKFVIGYIYELAGISLELSQQVMIETRLMNRVRKLNLNSIHEYILFLKSKVNEREIQNFIDALTTNKTHFFREDLHFSYVKSKIIELIKSKKEILLWCAAGSRGHEAYTLAFICEELKKKYSFTYKILSTDVDNSVTKIAADGIYSEDEVLALQSRVDIKSFFEVGTGKNKSLYKIKDFIKENIKFRQFNLVTEHFNSKILFDFIFLRNVLIYFDEKTRSSVVKKLLKNLNMSASLIIGYTEHLPNDIKSLKYVGKSIYLKNSIIDKKSQDVKNNKLILIGSSTGGVVALRTIITTLPKNFPPIVIVQHIPENFSMSFSNSLNMESSLSVKQVVDGDKILPNNVYIAPGDYHVKLIEKNGDLFVKTTRDPKVNQHRPSVDYLFASAKKIKTKKIIAIMLTGMGKDGAKEMLELKKLGHATIGQDEASCVVYGMPKAALDMGALDKQLPLKSIFPYIQRKLFK